MADLVTLWRGVRRVATPIPGAVGPQRRTRLAPGHVGRWWLIVGCRGHRACLFRCAFGSGQLRWRRPCRCHGLLVEQFRPVGWVSRRAGGRRARDRLAARRVGRRRSAPRCDQPQTRRVPDHRPARPAFAATTDGGDPRIRTRPGLARRGRAGPFRRHCRTASEARLRPSCPGAVDVPVWPPRSRRGERRSALRCVRAAPPHRSPGYGSSPGQLCAVASPKWQVVGLLPGPLDFCR